MYTVYSNNNILLNDLDFTITFNLTFPMYVRYLRQSISILVQTVNVNSYHLSILHFNVNIDDPNSIVEIHTYTTKL